MHCDPISAVPGTRHDKRFPTSQTGWARRWHLSRHVWMRSARSGTRSDSRYFLGAVIDLEEAYQWGFEELHRIQEAQRAIAKDLVGEPDIRTAYAALDADPARRIEGAEAFRSWMQNLADEAVANLAGKHFDIPDPIKRIECCIAPTHDGSIYYTDPAEDFSRPGQMWWAVPEGIDTFSTWKEVTTVYHEGVPGHHLQIAQNAYRSELLNRWQRKLFFCSGHGEGWALYAEQLMDDLGYLEPGDRMGMLDAQAFRTIRVIIDIGMHLQLQIPKINAWRFRPGERWTPAAGFEFMMDNCSADEPTLRFELNRYLGWPGQAPSYKVGERIWLEAREDARRRSGADFDLQQVPLRRLESWADGTRSTPCRPRSDLSADGCAGPARSRVGIRCPAQDLAQCRVGS